MKIVIVDDKAPENSYPMVEKVNLLRPQLRQKVIFFPGLYEFIELDKEEEEIISFRTDLTSVTYVFVHQYINHPFSDEPEDLLNALPTNCSLVLFSDSKSARLNMDYDRKIYSLVQNPIRPHYEIKRSILYTRFERFIGTEEKLGFFDLRALYEPDYNIQEVVIEELIKLIETYEKNAIELDRFKLLLKHLNYSPNQIDSIIERFRSMSCSEIIANLKQVNQ